MFLNDVPRVGITLRVLATGFASPYHYHLSLPWRRACEVRFLTKLHLKKWLLAIFFKCAAGGNRTHTRFVSHGFLRPTRLPIPPPRLAQDRGYSTSKQLDKKAGRKNLTQVLIILSYTLSTLAWICHIKYCMELFRELISKAFAADSIWSVVLRGVIWLVIAIVIIVSMDNPNADSSSAKLKSNLGFFLMFTIISGGLIYLLFGYVQA